MKKVALLCALLVFVLSAGAMAKTKGKGDPQMIKKLLEEKLR